MREMVPARPVRDALHQRPTCNCWRSWTKRTLSVPAVLCRELYGYGDDRYERLAAISVSHIYNLPRAEYRQRRVLLDKTRPATVSIGERRRPDPQGCPGYIRIDTVHQGDLNGAKGVYRIDTVDGITQWQIVGATAQISEAWLMPLLESMLAQFPFQLRDSIPITEASSSIMLEKLRIEQTKSRPRHSNDNGR